MLYFLRGKGSSDRNLRLFACGRRHTNGYPPCRMKRTENPWKSPNVLLLLGRSKDLAPPSRSQIGLGRRSLAWEVGGQRQQSRTLDGGIGVQMPWRWTTSRETRNVKRVLLRTSFGPLPFRSSSGPGLAPFDREHLATTISSESGGAFDRLPFLADALEDCRCNKADILKHFRAADACLSRLSAPLSCQSLGGFRKRGLFGDPHLLPTPISGSNAFDQYIRHTLPFFANRAAIWLFLGWGTFLIDR